MLNTFGVCCLLAAIVSTDFESNENLIMSNINSITCETK